MNTLARNGELTSTIRALVVIASVVVAVIYVQDKIERIIQREIAPLTEIVKAQGENIRELRALIIKPSGLYHGRP